ncbi:MAG: hypothetical protein GF308_00275 [Candidatus Heimdallarchaeota archaeon]|nr:hypothetical protein [Candidatus Heimdallarchaeota archaeon]
MNQQQNKTVFCQIGITLDQELLEQTLEKKYRATTFLALLQTINSQIDPNELFLMRYQLVKPWKFLLLFQSTNFKSLEEFLDKLPKIVDFIEETDLLEVKKITKEKH